MVKTVHIVMQGKGGAGKSLTSSMLVQYFQHADYNVQAIDLDPTTPTLSALKGAKMTSPVGASTAPQYLPSLEMVAEMCLRNTADIAREPDRVAHALLDSIVENYKPALDELAMEVAEVEQRALADPGKETLNTILQIKKEVLHLRQIIGPQKEVLSRFTRGEFKLIHAHLIPYYRDVYDGLFNIGEMAARYAESLTGVLQVYLNMSSNKTGEVVKVLTVFTVITTPMMLVGTWYGMNFNDMPEMGSGKAGYFIALWMTVAATLGTVVYFKLKKWL